MSRSNRGICSTLHTVFGKMNRAGTRFPVILGSVYEVVYHEWTVLNMVTGDIANRVLRGRPTRGAYQGCAILVLVVTLVGVRCEESCFCLQEYVKTLYNPITLLENENGDLFIAEQRGVIRHFGSRDANSFLLDITDRVITSTTSRDERGLLGFVLHPRFSENGKFYVYYIANYSNEQVSQISEFKAVENAAEGSSEKSLLRIPQPFNYGNGGQILIGDDGHLYIFVGDGIGDLARGLDKAQDPTSLLGKVLRIDIDTGELPNSETLPYAIPPDNPFVHNATWRPEIFAYGCRNMWRCSQDRQQDQHGKRRIFCGDPGASSYEEINIITKGKNYGWNIKEGYHCHHTEKCEAGPLENEEVPIYVLNFTRDGPHAVVGGYVYRGQIFKAIKGLYLYGDAMTGKISKLREVGNSWTSETFNLCPQEMCPCNSRAVPRDFLLAFGQDKLGELYLLMTSSFTTAVPDGVALKMVPPESKTDTPVTCGTPSLFILSLTTQAIVFLCGGLVW